MVIVETPRLILRQFTHEDFDAPHAIQSDPVGMKYVGRGVPFSPEQTRDALSKYVSCSTYSWSEPTLAEVPQVLRAIERKLISACGP